MKKFLGLALFYALLHLLLLLVVTLIRTDAGSTNTGTEETKTIKSWSI